MTFITDLRTLRQRCVAAHNRLTRDAGYSPVILVLQALPPDDRPPRESPGHLLISSFVFWGSRQIGGSRRGFERRLKQTTIEPYLKLHRDLKKGRFGAWQCQATDGANDRSTWTLVGPDAPGPQTVELVLNATCERHRPAVGDVRAGWLATVDHRRGLFFSIPIAEAASKRLARATARRAWHDDELPDGAALQSGEYERDVLTQAAFPDWTDLGLDPMYFLPIGERQRFPEDYRRSLLRTLTRDLGGNDDYWHLRLARADAHWIDHNLRQRLRPCRRQAARRTGRLGGELIDPTILPRLASDADCLRFVGLEPDGSVDLSRFPPLDGHPLRLLVLDDPWFEATGLGQETPIHQARRHLSGASEERLALEEAIAQHTQRLRWVCLIDNALAQPDSHSGLVRPGYLALRHVATTLFGPVVGVLTIADLLADTDGSTGRIESTLNDALVPEGDRPARVLDLPRRRYELGNIPGIGPKSVQRIADALSRALLDWPHQWTGRPNAPVAEAKQEIDAGLDALDDLFG